MPLTPQQRDVIASEMKKFGSGLSDDQKQKLQSVMSEASEKVQQFKQQNPNASSADLIKKITDNRAAIRQRLVNFLTPEQLSKWDSEMAKAKEFLGQKLAA